MECVVTPSGRPSRSLMAATYMSGGDLPPPPSAPSAVSSAPSPSPGTAPSAATAADQQELSGHDSPLNNNVSTGFGSSSYVMNLVNSSAAISAAAAASQYGSSPVRAPHEMHEMKYLPPQPHHGSAAALHNGHHHPLAHNPWGIPDPAAAMHVAATPWMHPHAGLYSQDLKQDIKPHSPADFNNVGRGAATGAAPPPPPPPHHMVHHPSSWNPPPPVSSPYLGMTSPSPSSVAAAVASSSSSSSNNGAQHPSATPPASSGASGGSGGGGSSGSGNGGGGGGSGGGHNSPSPLHHNPAAAVAAYGMNGMLPGQMPPGVVPPHPSFIDRYRDSHNSSPRSGTDEDGMLTPTSGTSGHHSLHPADEPFGNDHLPFSTCICRKRRD